MIQQIPLPLPHQQAMGRDDFLVTPSNQEAVRWLEIWPTWPSHGLILTGLAGSGKTHLSQVWLAQSRGRLLTFDALIGLSSSQLTEGEHALALDDADLLAGQADAEEKLFHLYNHVKEIKGSLLLTMTRGAGQAGFLLPDLRSRLLALPAAVLGSPDDTLLHALLVKQFRDRQIDLDAGVVAYLAPRMARDAASIRLLVERLDHAALAEGRKITTAMARRLLEETHD